LAYRCTIQRRNELQYRTIPARQGALQANYDK